jgi:quercetin dioxygenase-like cupin family protein
MPFIDFDSLEKETVTPRYSTAYGEVATGEQVELGRLRFKAGEGAVEHRHPHEQIMYVVAGRLRVTLEGETEEIGPGQAFHAPSDVPHEVKAVEDTEVLSCKSVIDGVGHKI